MSKKKSNASHTHYFFHLLYFQLLYEQVYSCIQQISKLWSLFLLDPHTDCSVLIVCTPPCLPLLLMKGLSLLPHFQKEDLDMTLREGGFTCQWGGGVLYGIGGTAISMHARVELRCMLVSCTYHTPKVGLRGKKCLPVTDKQ